MIRSGCGLSCQRKPQSTFRPKARKACVVLSRRMTCGAVRHTNMPVQKEAVTPACKSVPAIKCGRQIRARRMLTGAAEVGLLPGGEPITGVFAIRALISSTVHTISCDHMMRSSISFCVSWTTSIRISGTPSPVCAEVGTSETYSRKSVLR